ncbi:putative dehydrogenase [Oxalobacteraceae bacterium GrIS 2.11]
MTISDHDQSKPIRWGILGTGWIAGDFAAALQITPGAVLAAVGSRSLESAQAFGRKFQIETCYGSYQELADAKDVDAIYIATPHPLHAANAMMALHGGKAVLCEKPFTMNRHEAVPVVGLAHAKGLFLMEAMWSRFLPSLSEIKRIMASGEIGKVHHLSADFGFRATSDPTHRVHNMALGGGALLDIGIYPLSLAAYLMGPIQAAQAQAELGSTGTDLQTTFTLRHQTGGVSVGSCSLVAHTPNELTVSGELGYVRMHAPFHHSQTLSVVLHDGSTRSIDTPSLGNGYAHEAIEVMRCMRAGLIESPEMSHAETLTLMGWLDTMRGQIGLRYPADR